MICQIRKGSTEAEDIASSLYLYFLSFSLRNTSKAVSRFVRRIILQYETGFKNTNLRY